LAKVQDASRTRPDLVRCWLQAAPARKLVNLSRFPVLVLVSEASYHAGYDHCTARYLSQAGVQTDLRPPGRCRPARRRPHADAGEARRRVAAEIAGWLGKRKLD
jgi:hypothetical protein